MNQGWGIENLLSELPTPARLPSRWTSPWPPTLGRVSFRFSTRRAPAEISKINFEKFGKRRGLSFRYVAPKAVPAGRGLSSFSLWRDPACSLKIWFHNHHHRPGHAKTELRHGRQASVVAVVIVASASSRQGLEVLHKRGPEKALSCLPVPRPAARISDPRCRSTNLRFPAVSSRWGWARRRRCEIARSGGRGAGGPGCPASRC